MNSKQSAPPEAASMPRVLVSNGSFSVYHAEGSKMGEQIMMEAFGLSDRQLFFGMLRQLANAATSGGKVDEAQFSFLVAVVVGVKPRDAVEAMLAAQMAVVQTATMEFSKCLANANNIPEQDAHERVFNKVVRILPAQMEALKRYRSNADPSVTVQNVSVRDGGQAIVGNVTQHARAIASDEAISPALISADATAPMETLKYLEKAPVPIGPS